MILNFIAMLFHRKAKLNRLEQVQQVKKITLIQVLESNSLKGGYDPWLEDE